MYYKAAQAVNCQIKLQLASTTLTFTVQCAYHWASCVKSLRGLLQVEAQGAPGYLCHTIGSPRPVPDSLKIASADRYSARIVSFEKHIYILMR